MQGSEFIRLAGWLAATKADEAALRTAVGRAYYGAFHLAKGFLEELGIHVPGSAEGHATIVRDLQNCGDGDARLAGGLLRDLRTERNDADYNLAASRFTRIQNVRAVIETAVAVEQLLAGFQEPIRSAIRDGIREYRRRINQP